MGHLCAKNIYDQLGSKLDSLTTRTPQNRAFQDILAELYTPAEAELVVKMPAGLSSLEQLVRATKIERHALEPLLARACSKGLIIDLWLREEYHYSPSPFVIGLFEFTMMRTGAGCDYRKWAGLFYEYLSGSDEFYKANGDDKHQLSLMRTMPHAEAIADYVEVLDYEKARQIVESQDTFAIGYCSCRHEKEHLGLKECDTPLETCTSMGRSADYLVRHKMSRKISRTEMLEALDRSRELGLVFNADNVQRNVSYICHCCKCCCNALAGISKWGYANTIVSSTLIAQCDLDTCRGCGKCKRVCPVSSISLQEEDKEGKKSPVIDEKFCLGCGVCALKCSTGAMQLVSRKQRVIHPEDTFAKVLLLALDRGTLEHQLFPDRGKLSHRFMRGLVGGFCRLPAVKRALLSDQLRSRFLQSMKIGAQLQGKGWVTDL